MANPSVPRIRQLAASQTGVKHPRPLAEDRRIQVIYFIMVFRVLTFPEDGTGDPLKEYTFPITQTVGLQCRSS
jgi:hypothetical protein